MKKFLIVFVMLFAFTGSVFAQDDTTAANSATVDATVAEESAPADERFGEFVGAAESKVQRMVGLVIDLYEEGLSKEEITRRILARVKKIAEEKSANTNWGETIRNAVLRRGASGDDVSVIQRVISNLHFNATPLAVDGKFGPATEQAIKSFQRFVGLNPDGVIGPRTRAKIQERLQQNEETEGAAEEMIETTVTE